MSYTATSEAPPLAVRQREDAGASCLLPKREGHFVFESDHHRQTKQSRTAAMLIGWPWAARRCTIVFIGVALFGVPALRPPTLAWLGRKVLDRSSACRLTSRPCGGPVAQD